MKFKKNFCQKKVFKFNKRIRSLKIIKIKKK